MVWGSAGTLQARVASRSSGRHHRSIRVKKRTDMMALRMDLDEEFGCERVISDCVADCGAKSGFFPTARPSEQVQVGTVAVIDTAISSLTV